MTNLNEAARAAYETERSEATSAAQARADEARTAILDEVRRLDLPGLRRPAASRISRRAVVWASYRHMRFDTAWVVDLGEDVEAVAVDDRGTSSKPNWALFLLVKCPHCGESVQSEFHGRLKRVIPRPGQNFIHSDEATQRRVNKGNRSSNLKAIGRLLAGDLPIDGRHECPESVTVTMGTDEWREYHAWRAER